MFAVIPVERVRSTYHGQCTPGECSEARRSMEALKCARLSGLRVIVPVRIPLAGIHDYPSLRQTIRLVISGDSQLDVLISLPLSVSVLLDEDPADEVKRAETSVLCKYSVS